MSPALKLKGLIGLMLLFPTIVLLQLGMIVTGREGAGAAGLHFPYIVVLVLAGYTLVRITWRCGKQAFLSCRLHKQLRNNLHKRYTRQLNYKYQQWGTEIIVVRDFTFVALTIGLIHPKIVVSTAIVEEFSDKELEAILLHEWHHCRNYDGWRLFLSTLVTDTFGYWPIVKPVNQYYRIWKELYADRFVMERMGTELYLGRVLLKFVKLGRPAYQEAAVHFGDLALQVRIQQILEPEQVVKVQVSLLRPFLLSCLMLFFMLISGDS